MVSRAFRCDRSRLRLLLDDALPEGDQADLATHLESCESCRRALEEMAAESRWWGDARLLDGQPIAPDRIDDSAAETIGDHSSSGYGPSLGFLSPSEEPGSLGRMGAYEVTEVVGRGGMGVVLKAHDASLNRYVAIKVLAPELATSAPARRRFAREAQAAAAVAHEHIVAIHAVDTCPAGLPYLVMQYVAGKSLQERINKTGPLELKEILRIGMQAASGLAAAHAQGLIHRDIKPANILLENCVERVKITDFGLARAVDDASLTQSGLIAGTPQYMAPEQARGEAVDHRADLFSLGSVLYAMATGRPPFRAETTLGVIRRVCEEDPRPIRELNPDVPEWLAVLIGRLMAKDPARRFATAADVADLLERCLAHLQQPDAIALPPELAPIRPARRRPARRWAVAATALALAVAGLGASEAAGVTQVADFVATVLRIRTPEGTLIVEVGDPEAKVSIDGKDVVITGAGPQEVRLRPGTHELRASRPGAPEKVDFVTITRGDRQVAKVTFEPEGAAPNTASALGVLQERLSRAQDQLVSARHVTARADDPTIRRLEDRIKALEEELARRDQARPAPAPSPAPAGVELRLIPRPGTVAPSIDPNLSPRPVPSATPLPGGAARNPALPDGGSFRGPTLAFATNYPDEAWRVQYSPNGAVLAVAAGPVVRMRSTARFDVQKVLEGHRGPVTSLSFAPDGKTIATGSYDLTVRLWDVSSAKELLQMGDLGDVVLSVVYSPDGRTLAAAVRRQGVKVWEVPTGRVVHEIATPRQVVALRFSPDGKTLAGGTGGDRTDEPGEVRLWDLASGRLRATLQGHRAEVKALAFTPDGRFLASASDAPRPGEGGSVKFWDAATLDELKPLACPSGVDALAYSADGHALAIGLASGELMLWAPWGRPTFPAHDGPIFGVAFSPDGRRLATVGKDQTLKVWDLNAPAPDRPSPGPRPSPAADPNIVKP
jgi:hypothetical protein